VSKNEEVRDKSEKGSGSHTRRGKSNLNKKVSESKEKTCPKTEAGNGKMVRGGEAGVYKKKKKEGEERGGAPKIARCIKNNEELKRLKRESFEEGNQIN